MKKTMLIVAFIVSIFTSAYATESMIKTIPDGSTIVGPNDMELTYNYETNSVAVDFLVEASDAVAKLCDYFNGSWVDSGLTIYCMFGGDVYTCTAYKITKVLCGLNGAVRLYMEGDMNNALKKILVNGAQIWKMTKSGSSYTLSPSSKNMSSIDNEYNTNR